ncbi:MAG: hypothetical protein U0136_21605 [Bdellovibrionota bacterium]
MDQQLFWQAKWQQNETQWRGERVNDVLRDALPKLQSEFGISPGTNALVPLCGDSPAVRLLYDAGYSVTGIEYVPEAMEALVFGSFSDVELSKAGNIRRANRIELIEGDFFNFSAVNKFSLVYDRAGFVAIPERQRSAYGRIITDALTPGGVVLSRTAEFLGTEWKGAPPFSVTLEDVRAAFPHLEVLSYEYEDAVPTQPRYVEAGVAKIRHLTILLSRPR